MEVVGAVVQEIIWQTLGLWMVYMVVVGVKVRGKLLCTLEVLYMVVVAVIVRGKLLCTLEVLYMVVVAVIVRGKHWAKF